MSKNEDRMANNADPIRLLLSVCSGCAIFALTYLSENKETNGNLRTDHILLILSPQIRLPSDEQKLLTIAFPVSFLAGTLISPFTIINEPRREKIGFLHM